jgi:hypothetical protein
MLSMASVTRTHWQVDNCKVFCVVSMGGQQAGCFQACGAFGAARVACALPAFAVDPIPPSASESAPLRERTGGDNLTVSEGCSHAEPLLEARAATAGTIVRLNSYGWRDVAGGEANTHRFTPIVLFEYYAGRYVLQTPQPIGCCITVFSKINGPDIDNLISRSAYHDVLAGLSDGVHAVDPTLHVISGGFASCNLALDPKLRCYGTAIADPLDDGRLNGIDLNMYYHDMYYHDRWFPIANGNDHPAQHSFDASTQVAEIARDINYDSTEYNSAVGDTFGGGPDGPCAADEFLTAFWDEIGVAGDDSKPITVAALPCEPGPEPRADVMTASIHRWRGEPHHAGQSELSDCNADLVVWQDRPGWTDRPGTTIHLTLASDEIGGRTPGHTYLFHLQRSDAGE